MASEVLAVPERMLTEVLTVIRAGLAATKSHVSVETQERLAEWCDSEEEYLKGLQNHD